MIEKDNFSSLPFAERDKEEKIKNDYGTFLYCYTVKVFRIKLLIKRNAAIRVNIKVFFYKLPLRYQKYFNTYENTYEKYL